MYMTFLTSKSIFNTLLQLFNSLRSFCSSLEHALLLIGLSFPSSANNFLGFIKLVGIYFCVVVKESPVNLIHSPLLFVQVVMMDRLVCWCAQRTTSPTRTWVTNQTFAAPSPAAG